jgi:hypothetical protein
MSTTSCTCHDLLNLKLRADKKARYPSVSIILPYLDVMSPGFDIDNSIQDDSELLCKDVQLNDFSFIAASKSFSCTCLKILKMNKNSDNSYPDICVYIDIYIFFICITSKYI